MDRRFGHATEKEAAAIKELETVVRGRATPQAQLDLAQLYIEPGHAAELAVPILEDVHSLDPANERARLLLAYCLLHYIMDQPALKRAKELLGPLIQHHSELSAAASILLEETLQNLNETNPPSRIALLRHSVDSAPDWVTNHRRIARAYAAAGDRVPASQHIRQALRNATGPYPGWSPVQESFEACFTGRLESQEQLSAEVEEIERSR